jgi:hypothetical protein
LSGDIGLCDPDAGIDNHRGLSPRWPISRPPLAFRACLAIFLAVLMASGNKRVSASLAASPVPDAIAIARAMLSMPGVLVTVLAAID